MIYVGLCLLMFFKQTGLLFYPEKLANQHVFSFPWKFEEVWWDGPGARLHGLRFFADRPRGLVVYFHGNAGNVAGWGFAVEEFVSAGYDVVMPDYRSYGKSGGMLSSQRVLLEDALSVAAWGKENKRGGTFLLVGQSLGGAMAVYCAQTLKPDHLILISPFSSVTDTARVHFPWVPSFLIRFPFPAVKWIEGVTSPVTVFHGAQDSIVPLALGNRLAQVAPNLARWVPVPGADHNDILENDTFIRELHTTLSALDNAP